MIATNQPLEIVQIIENYKKQHDDREKNYIEVMLSSGGSLSYEDVMNMPVPAIQLFVEVINKRAEDQKASSRRR